MTMRLLAFHFTKPSNSEANVLANLCRAQPGGLEIILVVNRRGESDTASHFLGLDAAPSIEVLSEDVGLPVDPSRPESRVLRVLARSRHRFRRRHLLGLAAQRNVDAVYTSQQRFDCLAGGWVARRLGVPHVIHLHYRPEELLGRSTLEQLRTCDHVIAVSDYIAGLAIDAGVRRDRVSVIHNSVAIPPGSSDESVRHGRLTVGQIGRMSPEKGFVETVRAFASVRDHVGDALLLLVGDGSDRPNVGRCVRELGVESSTRFVGWCERVAPFLDEMDVFLHPSENEPFGLSVLEAMAAGKPVIALHGGGTPELVVDGVTGTLVRPGHQDELNAALLDLCMDGDKRRRFGAAGRARAAEQFSVDAAGAAFAAVFRKLSMEERT